jgi:transposase InsO family protein
LFRTALADRGIHHKRTRPYTPRTSGKAERFIEISLREWIYATPFGHPRIAPPPCRPGRATTTADDLTPHSAENHPSLD